MNKLAKHTKTCRDDFAGYDIFNADGLKIGDVRRIANWFLKDLEGGGWEANIFFPADARRQGNFNECRRWAKAFDPVRDLTQVDRVWLSRFSEGRSYLRTLEG